MLIADYRHMNSARTLESSCFQPAFPIPKRDRSAIGFVLADVLVGAAMIVFFAAGTAAAMTRVNTNAAVNRNNIAAQAIVRTQIDQALTASFTAEVTAAILSTTVSGADVDGDGEGDGELFQSDVPLIVARAGEGGSTPPRIVTGSLYRQVIVADVPLNLRRVSFLLSYPYRGRTYFYRMATLRAQDR